MPRAPYRSQWSLAALVAAGVAVAAVPAPACANEFIRGDVNYDGRVSISDLVHLAHNRLLEGPGPVCDDAADADDDGSLTLLDVYALLEHLFGRLGNPLPAPSGSPGEDPTQDELEGCVLAAVDVEAGVDIDHVYYITHDGRGATGIAVHPGQSKVRVPVYLDTNVPLSACIVSLEYDPAQILAAKLDFAGSSGRRLGADRVASISKVTEGGAHFLVGYVLMLLAYEENDELAIPGGDEQLLVTLEVDLAEDLEIGAEVVISFVEAPAVANEPAATNEVVAPGLHPSYPDTIDIALPVVHESSMFMRGDVTRDAALSILDVFALLEFLFGSDSYPIPCGDAADLNDDGGITLSDPLALLTFMYVDSSRAPAKPFPYLGVDTTTDDDYLECAGD